MGAKRSKHSAIEVPRFVLDRKMGGASVIYLKEGGMKIE